MATLVLEPTPIELGRNRSAYEELASRLEAAGHTTQIRISDERRALPEVQAAYELVVWVSGRLEDIAVDALLLEVLACLSPGHRRHRRAQLRDAAGRTKDFVLGPPEDSGDDAS